MTTTPPPFFTTSVITREAAAALIDAARKASEAIGFEPAIAITDPSGHLRAFERTDNSSFLAADIAIDKAWTAATFGIDTNVWIEVLKEPGAAYLQHRPRLTPVGGGFPISIDGKLIGGLGISGGNHAQDREACIVALQALGYATA
ncbi:heme-binding protein [Burkholderia sp. 22PA0099]|uniref:GlcG/HbpS family heme-binding protein n=1 Tax=Burkholderia sp. 22PA0099 TaxID=3237372 RepID=UPI0039C0F16C